MEGSGYSHPRRVSWLLLSAGRPHSRGPGAGQGHSSSPISLLPQTVRGLTCLLWLFMSLAMPWAWATPQHPTQL